jgi:hypothetical protein
MSRINSYNFSEKINLTVVFNKLLQKCYSEYVKLVETLGSKQDEIKKKEISIFLEKYRVLFIRALNVVIWCKNYEKYEKCHSILSSVEEKEFFYKAAAEHLSNFHRDLWKKRAPFYAVPAALDVLSRGTYSSLPLCMRVDPFPILSKSDRLECIHKLNVLLRLFLLEIKRPSDVQISVLGGRVYIERENLYEIALTLFGPEKNFCWRVISLKLLIKPTEDIEFMLENENNWLDSSAFKSAQTNEILFLLQEFLYSKPEDPFVEVCQLLDEFSLSLQLSYLHVQANFLNSEKWASFLKIVFTKNSHLLIYYWRNFQHFDLRPINEQEKRKQIYYNYYYNNRFYYRSFH